MKKRIKTKIKTTATPYLFLFPCAALILVILIYPVLSGIINSFYNESLIRPVQSEFVALDNYKSLLTDSMFLDALRRSVLWTLVILVFELFFGLLFAVLLNKDIYCKKLFRCLVLIPWIIPNAIAGIIWKWFLNESFGMMNYILKSIGIISHNLSWLSDEKLAAVSVVMVIIWKSIPFVAITLLAGIQAIPGDLYEAAKVDGARGSQCFRFVTIPMLKSIMSTCCRLKFNNTSAPRKSCRSRSPFLRSASFFLSSVRYGLHEAARKSFPTAFMVNTRIIQIP